MRMKVAPDDGQPLRSAHVPSGSKNDRRLGKRRCGGSFRKSKPIEIAAELSRHSTFGTLSKKDLAALLEQAQDVTFTLGSIILRQGELGKGLFIIKLGKVRIVDESDPVSPVNITVLGPGAIFGERSLLQNVPINATVRAAGTVILKALTVHAFRDLVNDHPEIAQRMRENIARYELFNFLKAIPELSSLTPRETYQLVEVASEVKLEANASLPDDDAVFVVKSGELSAYIQPPDAPRDPAAEKQAEEPREAVPRRVSVFRSTDLIGLTKLIERDDAQTMTILVNVESRLLRIPARHIRRAFSNNPDANEAATLAVSALGQRIEAILSAPEISEEDDNPTSSDLIVPVRGPHGAKLWHSMDARLDGVACLAMAAEWLGVGFDSAQAIEEQAARHHPDTLISLSRKAENAGLVSRRLSIDGNRIAASLMPLCYKDSDGRLKLVLEVKRQRIVGVDPSTGNQFRVDRASFEKNWPGEALWISHAPDFGLVGEEHAGLLQRFGPVLKPHRLTLVHVVILALFGLAIGVMLPLASRTIVNRVLVFDDRSLLVVLLAALLFGSFMSLISNAARTMLTRRAASMVNETLASRLFAHVLAVPQGKLQSWTTAELAMRFDENQKIFGLATTIAQTMLFDVIAVLVFGIALFVVAPSLGLIGVSFAVVVGLLLMRASPHLRDLGCQIFDTRRDLQSHYIETLESIETIKYAGRETDFLNRGKLLFRRSTLAELSGARLSFRLEMAITALTVVSTISTLGIGGAMVLSGSLSAGDLVAAAGLLGGMTGPLVRVAETYDQLIELRISVNRVNDVLELPREATTGVAACPPLAGHIRLENVFFSYEAEAEPVLRGLEIDILPGSKVGICGSSGSGKSTLAKLVNRLLDPTSGRVMIDGLDIAQLDVDSLRRQIGVVEQTPHVFAGSIRENIAKVVPDLPFERVATAARIAGIADFIEALPMRYDTRVGDGGRVLSGGQVQRLAIARAIASDPKILILDEATSALDVESERALQSSLDAAMQGRTVVSVAHRLGTIRNADRIIVLESGVIAEEGTHATLSASGGAYARLLVEGGDFDAAASAGDHGGLAIDLAGSPRSVSNRVGPEDRKTAVAS